MNDFSLEKLDAMIAKGRELNKTFDADTRNFNVPSTYQKAA